MSTMKGCWTHTSSGKGFWWIRTPGNAYGSWVATVQDRGGVDETAHTITFNHKYLTGTCNILIWKIPPDEINHRRDFYVSNVATVWLVPKF